MRQLVRFLPFIVVTLLAGAFFGVIAVIVLLSLAVLVPVAILTARLIFRFRPDLVRPKQDSGTTVIETATYTVETVDDGKPPRR